MGLTIRETTANDLPELGRLWNDGTVMRWVGFLNGLGCDEEALRAWFRRLRSSAHAHHLLIRDSDLGFCGELGPAETAQPKPTRATFSTGIFYRIRSPNLV